MLPVGSCWARRPSTSSQIQQNNSNPRRLNAFLAKTNRRPNGIHGAVSIVMNRNTSSIAAKFIWLTRTIPRSGGTLRLLRLRLLFLSNVELRRQSMFRFQSLSFMRLLCVVNLMSLQTPENRVATVSAHSYFTITLHIRARWVRV